MQQPDTMLAGEICLQACIKGLKLNCLTQNHGAEVSEKWKKMSGNENCLSPAGIFKINYLITW